MIGRALSGGLVALLALLALTAAPAAAQCNPGSIDPVRNDTAIHPYWVGTQQTPGGTLYGVKSTIWNYAPYVNQGSFSYAWVMLTAGGSYHWAQIGPHSVWNSRDMHIQTADGSSSTIWDLNTAAQPLSTYTAVEADWVLGGVQFYVGGTMVARKLISTWTPTNGQFYGEVQSLATQMMGAQNNKVDFLASSLKYGSPAAWNAISGTLSSTYPTYFKYTGSAYNFSIWDATCAN